MTAEVQAQQSFLSLQREREHQADIMDPGQGYIRHDLAVGPDRDSPTTQAATHLLHENLAPVYGPWLRFQQWDPRSGELKMLNPQQSAPPWPAERHVLCAFQGGPKAAAVLKA